MDYYTERGGFALPRSGKISSAEFTHKGSQLTELMSLFFYHLYRKLTVEMFNDFLNAYERNADD